MVHLFYKRIRTHNKTITKDPYRCGIRMSLIENH